MLDDEEGKHFENWKPLKRNYNLHILKKCLLGWLLSLFSKKVFAFIRMDH
jgi:hypothetical protein